MPKQGHRSSSSNRFSNWMLFKTFDRPRTAKEPPFFFREVRIVFLTMSILYNLTRLIFELTVMDVSVLLVATRLLLTTLQLVDHWWFCKNWESFFIEKKMRAYIWFRFFVAMSIWSMLFCVQTTFSPSITNLTNDTFLWVSGVQVMIWYLWGKKWSLKWGDMCDERRMPAVVGSMFTTSFIFGMLCVHIYIDIQQQQESSLVTAITATIAYFLMGVAFRYLNLVTNRNSTMERTVDVDEGDGGDGDSPSLPTPATRSSVLKDIEMDVDSENHTIERVKPVIITRNSSNLFVFSSSSSNKGQVAIDTAQNNANNPSHVHSNSELTFDDTLVSPLSNSHHDRSIIVHDHMLSTTMDNTCHNDHSVNTNDQLVVTNDHNRPLHRQNTCELNLAYYETAHLLGDKIVVVFVQVTNYLDLPYFYLNLTQLYLDQPIAYPNPNLYPYPCRTLSLIFILTQPC